MDQTTQSIDSLTPDQLIDSLSFVIFDLETTGGNHQFDKIIEIGLVKMKGRQIVDELALLIDPEIAIPDFIQRLTGLTSDKLKGMPPIEQVIHQILDFMGEDILVAHNSSFDVPFFNSVLHRLGIKQLRNKVLCTNLMTKYMIPEIMNSNLTYMSQIFGIPHHKAHRALEDAKATGLLLKTYLDIFVEKKVKKVNQLYYPRNKFELDRRHFKKEDGLDTLLNLVKNSQVPLCLLAKGEQGVILLTLPLLPGSNLIDSLEEKLTRTPYQIITIKLLGSGLQCLFELAHNYSKIPREEIDWSLEFLIKQYQTPSLESLKEGFILESSFIYQGDFFVLPHLVPEQLIIFSLHNLWPKKDLVFRFPAHKKKMLQYISSQSRRIPSGRKKFRNHFIPDALLPLIDSYVKSHPDEIWFFNADLAQKKSNDLHQLLTDFLGKNLASQKYPQFHL